MTFALPSPNGRFLLVICSAILAALLSYFGMRNALAAHYQDADTRAGYERAVQLEPADSRNWYLLGRSYLYDLEQPDAARAIQAFRKAVSLDPYSAETMLDLATAYDGEGDTAHARESYVAAQMVWERLIAFQSNALQSIGLQPIALQQKVPLRDLVAYVDAVKQRRGPAA